MDKRKWKKISVSKSFEYLNEGFTPSCASDGKSKFGKLWVMKKWKLKERKK